MGTLTSSCTTETSRMYEGSQSNGISKYIELSALSNSKLRTTS